MPPQSISLDTPVNARVRKLVMEMDQVPSLRTSNSEMTDMYGGTRVERYVASGNSGSYPSSSLGDYQSVSGTPERLIDVSVGGKINRYKKAKKWTGYAVDTVKSGLGLAKMGKDIFGGKISRSKKAKKWTGYAVDTVKSGLGLAKMGKDIFGGKISRSKKAKKWTGYAVDTVKSGLGLAKMGKDIFGGGLAEDIKMVARSPLARKALKEVSKMPVVRRGRAKAEKVLADPMVKEVIKRVRKMPVVKRELAKAKALVGGYSSGGKKPTARGLLVKKIMAEQGLSMIQASSFIKQNGLY